MSPNLYKRVSGFFDRMSPGEWLPVVSRLPDGINAVGLSYDDGPSPESTPELLRILARHNARATFFVSGERAFSSLDLVRRMVDEGHDVCSHSWSHIHYKRVPRKRLIEDLERTEDLLSSVRPTPSPYLVRLPYGGGHGRPSFHRALRKWNPSAQIAHWDHVAGDWMLASGGDLRAASMRAVDQIMRSPKLAGSILLLHEDPYGVNAPMAAHIAPTLAEILLPRLRDAGLGATKLVPAAPQSSVTRYFRPWEPPLFQVTYP